MRDDASKASKSLLDTLDSTLQAFGGLSVPAGPEAQWEDNEIETDSPGAGGSEIRRRLGRVRDFSSPLTQAAVADAPFLAGLGRSSVPVSNGGFHLNYDADTPLRPIDVGGADQQQRMAEFITRSIDNLSHGLTVKSALEELGLKSHQDLLPGLEVRLLSHQVIGVAWMVAKERGPDRGGILADDMGLGKTVQMIATMAANMPNIEDECRTTLIVVPAALLQQWKDEIDTKTNGVFTVHIHHGKDKLKKLSDVRSKDVVITTYQSLNMDFVVPSDVGPEEEAEWLAEHGGVIARTRFYRAIADEAQFIRNRSTRSSTCLAHVRAKYRWMLTGTPVTNTLADIYGLLRFGRFRPWNDWKDFNDHVARVQFEDAPLAGSRAQAILKPILLRRTKNSTLEGKPLLQLPPKEIELVQLQFSAEERDVYDSFEKRTKIRLNKFIRERTLVKNHAIVLVLILRMRQLCCHPKLILALTDDYEDPTLIMAGDAEKELGRARKIMGAAWVAETKQRFLLRARATELLDFHDEGNDDLENSCPVCKDLFLEDNGRVLACGHQICFDCSLNLSNSPIVHDGIFGHGNEKENLAIEKEYEKAVAKGYRPCPTCKKMMDLTPEKVFKSSAFEPTDEELSNHARAQRRAQRKPSSQTKHSKIIRVRSPSPEKSWEERAMDSDDDDLPDVSEMFDRRSAKRQKKSLVDDEEVMDLTMNDISKPLPPKKSQKSSPPKGKKKQENADGLSEAVLATWSKGDDDLEPSTKMLALIDYLKEWETTGDKTICYSQWTSMLDLIEILFSRHGIRSLRFDGKMDRAARDSTLATFKQAGGPKVILISTKCGSVGLNLVSANRIINMDLSWNYAAESQAYDRCHRIGQEKPVYVKRLVVENTIEERMLRLQEVKVGLAEAALGEGTGAKLHKLSVKDIRYLFGMTTTPSVEGNPGAEGGDN
ncbi:SNF2 family N-terminal domain-containing protein [Infundibulicybe gibba]|nr:SNF2 family N-terminal domain-containing protein [Infundibulicybe gibba]